jgi:hypothetical protein
MPPRILPITLNITFSDATWDKKPYLKDKISYI